MGIALSALDRATQRIVATLDDPDRPYDEKMGSHLAWVTAKIAEVTTALRQLEKHDRVMSKSPEQRFKLVCVYLRTEATPEQRADVQRLLAELDNARVVS